MQVASLELSRTLYKLSGKTWIENSIHPDIKSDDDWAPRYSLGYLLRKLPPRVFMFNGLITMFGVEPDGRAKELRFHLVQDTYGEEGDLDWIWIALYGENCPDSNYKLCPEGDTPEDAICSLAIELFKQEILKKENT